eukprot:TRINITY_DN14390_c0_g1_i1.p1 TRINITY_DN14390_c0_g1~~TRINITY_DN14390_c0_g1_i1.p1  ORF type:complete len:288 (+),score=21.06 TRINITY_DN14390_c0_g1_i1:83-865(+)
MSSILILFVICLSAMAARDLKYFVTGDGFNRGQTYLYTQATAPLYTPGQANQVFDTVLETNFSSGLGRFLGTRDVSIQTAGPGNQFIAGYADIKGNLTTLGAAGIFNSVGNSFTTASASNFGANGTIGATFVNITNDNVVFTGFDPTQPHGSFVQNSFVAGSIRNGSGLTDARGFSVADSLTFDSVKPTFATGNSIGSSSAAIIGNDTISFAEGNSFAVSGSNEAVTGCQQSSGAAAYGADGGYDGQTGSACSSRGVFFG